MFSNFSKVRDDVFEWIGYQDSGDGSRHLEYSIFVSKLKGVVTFSILLLIFAMMIWPFTDAGKGVFRVNFDASDGSRDISDASMERPRFHGVDSKKRPFNIRADIAIKNAEDTILLKKIEADITLANGGWFSVLGEKGIYILSEKRLVMDESVNIFFDNGYEIYTEYADINMISNKTSGDKGILSHGALGTLKSESYIMTNDGDEIVFEGNVQLIAVPRK